MKITCSTNKLSDAVLKVQRAVSSKSSIPALEGINITTKENSIELKGYDLELGITTTIPAKIEEPGETVLNAKLFSEIARHLPQNETQINVLDKFLTEIKSGQAQFSIEGLNPEDYPEMPKFNDSRYVEIESNKLKKNSMEMH